MSTENVMPFPAPEKPDENVARRKDFKVRDPVRHETSSLMSRLKKFEEDTEKQGEEISKRFAEKDANKKSDGAAAEEKRSA